MVNLLVDQLRVFLGKFGGAHIDARDAIAAFTCMLILSRLPVDYDPGYICLLELGVAFPLRKFHTIYFSGLRWHAGTFPTAPDGTIKVEADALRLTMVAYPSFASFDFGKKLSYFAAMPKKGGVAQEEPDDDDDNVANREGRGKSTGKNPTDLGVFRISPEMTGTM